jgi:hypothetical protein
LITPCERAPGALPSRFILRAAPIAITGTFLPKRRPRAERAWKGIVMANKASVRDAQDQRVAEHLMEAGLIARARRRDEFAIRAIMTRYNRKALPGRARRAEG